MPKSTTSHVSQQRLLPVATHGGNASKDCIEWIVDWKIICHVMIAICNKIFYCMNWKGRQSGPRDLLLCTFITLSKIVSGVKSGEVATGTVVFLSL